MTERPQRSGLEQLPETLDDVLADAWTRLDRGTRDRRDGFHQPVLATIDATGVPAARVVVLRGADREARTVCCHSDRRSPKVAELRVLAEAAWLFYDAASRVQVRVSGRTDVLLPEHDAEASEAWEQTRDFSRRCYLAPHAPSTPDERATPNLPEDLLDRAPQMQRSEQGRGRFCRIRTSIRTLDWLALRHDGHRRARFVWDGDGHALANWLRP